MFIPIAKFNLFFKRGSIKGILSFFNFMNSEKIKLKDIAQIQAGYSFREGIKPIRTGSFQVIQIKDIGRNGDILADDLTRTDADNIKPEHFVRQGDVLFTTRGTNRRAAFVTEEMPETVFVAQILSLRNIRPDISPAYLAWYINQQPAQDYFGMTSSGSYIQNIKIDVFAELEVRIPPLETQKRILEIHTLRLREIELVEEIQAKRNQVIEQTLMKAIK